MSRWKLAFEASAKNVRRLAIMGALVFGFSAAIILGACAGGGEADDASKPSFTGRTPERVGRIPLRPAPPTNDAASECAAEVENPCMRYLIPLVGNPTTDLVLQAQYSAAFGPACYLSDEDPSTFNCFYKSIKKACADAKLIGDVSGNDPYAKTYNCQPVGNGDYWLQIGPDVANKLFIYRQDAPRQTPLIDINGIPTAVNGPYRNLPEPEDLEPGKPFSLKQKELILQVNRETHIGDGGEGEIHSDLAGFEYPCDGPNKPLCKEPLVLQVERPNDPDAAQVHHVIRMNDLRCCAWGTNSTSNAAVISRKLNRFLWYKFPTTTEVLHINQAIPYAP